MTLGTLLVALEIPLVAIVVQLMAELQPSKFTWWYSQLSGGGSRSSACTGGSAQLVALEAPFRVCVAQIVVLVVLPVAPVALLASRGSNSAWEGQCGGAVARQLPRRVSRAAWW
eukprot:956375-Pyramimonas_sp.AAC.1